MSKYIVDGDVIPTQQTHGRYIVISHKKMGLIDLSKEEIDLHLLPRMPEDREDGKGLWYWKQVVTDHLLDDLPILNANVMFHLLENPELISEDWKGKCVCFWGTIYRAFSTPGWKEGDWWDEYLFTYFIFWSPITECWEAGKVWLGDDYPSFCFPIHRYPVAILKKKT